MTLATEVRKRDRGDVILALLTIEHADLAAPIRVVNNDEDVTSRGDVFEAAAWKMQLPDQGEDASYQAKIVVANVHSQIVRSLKSSPVPPTILIELVMASDPDSVERALSGFGLMEATFDSTEIVALLRLPDFRVEPVCAKRFIPSVFPMLFA